MGNKFTFTIIGGDDRQVELIYMLLRKGHRVNALGFDNIVDTRANIFQGLQEELGNCHVLVLPIPYNNEKGYINIRKSNINITLADTIKYLGDHKPLLVLGRMDDAFESLALAKGLPHVDLLRDESFAILNAIPTAEGAIQRAMEEASITIHNSRTLVLGYGRIGKSLSRMLKAIGSRVSVEARKVEDLAWIAENGYKGVHLKDLGGILPDQDIIFNTIPHLILDRDKLKLIDKDCVIIDLSSHPGGVDFIAAKELGLRASLDLGLPGKVAPRTAAKIIYKVILEELEERV